MASWFTRALDVITPWDRGGEVQRREERKRREEEERQNQISRAPSQVPSVRNTTNRFIEVDDEKPDIQVQKPENKIGTLKVDNQLGKLNTTVSVENTSDTKPVEVPKPGVIVAPIEYPKPRQSLANKFRDVFDANTESDKYRRGVKDAQEINDRLVAGGVNPTRARAAAINIARKHQASTNYKTIVDYGRDFDKDVVRGLATIPASVGRVATGVGEGALDLGGFALGTVPNSAIQYLRNGSVSGSSNNVINNITNAISEHTVDPASRFLDRSAKAISGDDRNRVYNTTQVGTNAIGMLSGIGALSTMSKAGRSGQLADASNYQKIVSMIGRQLSASPDNTVINRITSPIISGSDTLVNRPLRGTVNYLADRFPALRNLFPPQLYKSNTPSAADTVETLDDAAISASAEAANQASRPRPITVTKDIPVDAPIVPDQPVNVRVLTQPKPIIKEFPGDATSTTPDALVRRSVQESREQAARDANFQNRLTQDQINASEGITPRKPEEPFVLDQKVATDAQNNLVDDYANQLKSYDDSVKGGQMQKVDDGSYSGTYVRTSEHSKFYRDYYAKNGRPPSKAAWREEAERQLRSGRADSEVQKAFNDAADPEVQSMLAKGERPDVPEGKKIEVKEVKSIPVRDETVAPQGLPETPGQVRATTATAPAKAKSEAIASQPTTVPPAALPKVGSTLPDGTVVTKRMVQSARNQRKNARALNKAQQETADALEEVNNRTAPNNASDSRQPGIIKSNDTRKGKHGVYQVAHQADQTSETGTKSTAQIIQEADDSIKTHGSMNDRDIANVKDALERAKTGTPEYKKLSDLYHKEAGTHSGQRLALRKQPNHRTATSRQIHSHAISKITALAEDTSKLTDDMVAKIEKSVDNYTSVRDRLTKAYDDFNANPSKENHATVMQLSKDMKTAEKQMAMDQYNTAKKVLKGNSDPKARRAIEDAADKADVYTMDFVDSALLSSTGTFVRNFVNAGLGSVEEGLFGGIGSRIGRLGGDTVGGGIGRGSLSGFRRGAGNIVNAYKARAKNAGWNPIENMKNWSTTGNQLGDSMIEGSAFRSTRNKYVKDLKAQGYSGKELQMRADVLASRDADGLLPRGSQSYYHETYAPQARKDAGLGSGISKRSSAEKYLQRAIADGIGNATNGKIPANAVESFSKAVTRLTIGFPSAVGRSFVAGSQRVVPLVNVDTVKAFTAPSKTLRSAAIKESVKKSGSAVAVGTLFYSLGQNGYISGSYPKDPNERQRWQDEGIKENSIKIGDAWYDIPSYMGSFGMPALFYASAGRNGGLGKDTWDDIVSIAGSISPTDGIEKMTKALNGVTDLGKYTQGLAASTARMATPYGSLLNQISKVFDPTENDTSSDTWVGGVINKIVDGIPGLDSHGPLALPDKTDSNGNPLKNPNFLETMAGSNGAVQKSGVEYHKGVDNQINSTLDTIKGYGILDNKALTDSLDSTAKEAYVKYTTGKQLDESDIKSLQAGLVKGVTAGTDTAYLERNDWDTNLAVLKIKRDTMQNDPTVKPSSIEDIEKDIKRGEFYKDNQTSYEDITDYKSIGVEDWRKMGDPESDSYDPDMYQKLWELDQAMTENGIGYGKKGKNKYYLKEKKSGSGSRSGGSKGKSLSVDFGKLSKANFAPKIKEYETLTQTTGTVPRIKRKQPNIVHTIKSGRL